MLKSLTLEYWIDDGWYIGRLKEVPGVFSQGETLTDSGEKSCLLPLKRANRCTHHPRGQCSNANCLTRLKTPLRLCGKDIHGQSRPLFYLLGGNERFLTDVHREFDIITEAMSHYDTGHGYPMVVKEYQPGYDWFHQGEGNYTVLYALYGRAQQSGEHRTC